MGGSFDDVLLGSIGIVFITVIILIILLIILAIVAWCNIENSCKLALSIFFFTMFVIFFVVVLFSLGFHTAFGSGSCCGLIGNIIAWIFVILLVVLAIRCLASVLRTRESETDCA